MAGKQISELPTTPGLDLTDLLASKKGSKDYKTTIEEVADLVIAKLTGSEVMTKIRTVDTDSSGLNANTLQGKTASQLANVPIQNNTSTSTLNSTDKLPLTRSTGTVDLKADLSTISSYVNGILSGSEVLTKLKLVDTNSSGLNANTLQGYTASQLANVPISDLPYTSSLDGSDRLIISDNDGVVSRKTNLSFISDFINDDLDPSAVLNKLLTVDTNTSNLNANFLQGFTSDELRDAGNLNSGIVSSSRLPNGIFSSSITGSTSKYAVKFPTFIFGLQRIMIQFGNTTGYTTDQTFNIAFKESFASGITSNNTPLVIVGSEYVSGSGTAEMTVNCRSSNLTSWTGGVSRVTGTGTDYVRANWIAIGKY